MKHEHYEGNEAGESFYVVMAFMNIHIQKLCEKIKEWLGLRLDGKPISVISFRLHME